jgi:serine/threonine protein phosphatase PrpC
MARIFRVRGCDSWGIGVTSYLRPVYSARTDSGQQRDHNEDYVHAGALGVDSAGQSLWYVFAVADGVGGHQHGEWASQTAIETLQKQVVAELEQASPLDMLGDAFRAANTAIWESVGELPTKSRAATTLVATLLRQGTLWWANVGDSRAYLVRRGQAVRLTKDHSWVEEQVRAGFMTADEARISGRRNVITRSIGFDKDVQVDLGGPVTLRSGDALILCSDGLHGQVTDDELARVVQQLLPEAAAERLVALSNERGGPDNISVIVCAMFDASSSESARTGEGPTPEVTVE